MLWLELIPLISCLLAPTWVLNDSYIYLECLSEACHNINVFWQEKCLRCRSRSSCVYVPALNWKKSRPTKGAHTASRERVCLGWFEREAVPNSLLRDLGEL